MVRIRKKVVVFAFVVCILTVAMVIFSRLDPGSRLPNPNGYDDFVKAGQMVTPTLDGPRYLGNYRELSLDELRAFAATNAEALKIARSALDRQCRVPVRNTQDWFRAHLGEMLTFNHLAFGFCLEGWLAQLEGRTNDAVNTYLDLVRFAHESTRGGMIIETSVARTLEALGTEGLKSVQPSLNAAQCRRIAKVLEEIDSRREPWSDCFKRNVRYELRAELKTVFSLEHWRSGQRFKRRYYQAELQRRQTMIAFAARAYELETRKKPTSVTNLVPAYLKSNPQDAVSHTNLVLTP